MKKTVTVDLEKQVSDKLTEFFHDPIDTPCAYCEAAKAVIEILTPSLKPNEQLAIVEKESEYPKITIHDGDFTQQIGWQYDRAGRTHKVIRIIECRGQ